MAGKKDIAKTVQRGKPKAGNTPLETLTPGTMNHVAAPALAQGLDLLERVSDGFVAFDARMNYTILAKDNKWYISSKKDKLGIGL